MQASGAEDEEHYGGAGGPATRRVAKMASDQCGCSRCARSYSVSGRR